MVFHVNGPPGNGKSSFLMWNAEREFVLTRRNLVLNIKMDVPRFQDYMFKKYKDQKLEILKRLYFIDWSKALFWWRYRGFRDDGSEIIWKPRVRDVWVADGGEITVPYVPGIDQEYPGGLQKRQIEWPEPDVDDPGVCYFLDEWQEEYDQHCHAEFTREHSSALNQHRKFRADLWVGSPFLSQLAKPYREVGQSFFEMRNSGYESNGYGWATVRAPTKFFWNAYRRPKTSERDKPMCGGVFGLDIKGLHSCFDTSAGTGVGGGLSDAGLKRRGKHWSWLIVFVVVGIITAKLVFWPAVKGMTWFLRPSRFGAPTMQQSHAQEPAKNAPVAAVSAPPLPPAQQFLPQPRPQPRPPVVTIRWVSRIADHMTFGLSDGTELDNPDGIWTGKILMMRNGQAYAYEPQRQADSQQPPSTRLPLPK
jgi:hypothetical protein